MPAAIKRRKVTATTFENASSSTRKPQGITAFTRVSKATTGAKSVTGKNSYVDTIVITQLELDSTPNKKRKLAGENTKQAPEEEACSVLSNTVKNKNSKVLPRLRSRHFQSVPPTPQKSFLSSASISAETPTKVFNDLLLSSQPHTSPLSTESPSKSKPKPVHRNSHQTSPSELPTELLDLVNLHAAFLTALSLHYAHNGTHCPADLRILCPDVARAWGKRRVIIEDIRRTLALLNISSPADTTDGRVSRLSLSDYGQGKICIEIDTGADRAWKVARAVNENALNEIYVRNLMTSWNERGTVGMKPTEFIENLQLAPITNCPSLIHISPLLAKGQRRLEDLKAGMTVKKAISKPKVSAVEVSKGNGAKPTLLERLRAKQLHQSALPPPPSKAELGRKAALQRIDEVVAILTTLSTSSSVGQQRISFTFPTAIGRLQDSFRMPLSKEEGSTCLRLLASEIAPAWLKIVKMGKSEAIVFNRDERPGDLDIKERVKSAS